MIEAVPTAADRRAMRILAAVSAVLALTVVPFHGEAIVVVLVLVLALGGTLRRARTIAA